ncbi:MAG: YbaN family protein [Acidimicrobiia bacterium]
MQLARSRAVRTVYLALGIFFLGLGLAGTVLPLIPTTGPILLAAFFFSRSSERFETWLLNHRVFGGIVRDWRAGRGFSPRAKGVAVAAIAVTFGITVGLAIDSTPVRVLLVLLAVGLIVYILRLPTKRSSPELVD